MSRALVARKPVGKLLHSYVSTNVTTSAWVALSTTVPAAATTMEVFDSSGRIMKYSIDAGVTELKFYGLPGGMEELIPVEWSKGSTISIKAVDASATVGYLVINFYG